MNATSISSVNFAPKHLSGIDVIDDAWGGLYRGGSYLVYGRAASGRGLLTLMFARTGAAFSETTLLVSPDRQKDLMIQAASIGFNLREAHDSGIVRLLRVPPLMNLQHMGDDGVSKALWDLVTLIRRHRPTRLIMNDFMPFVAFRSFDRFRNEFIQFLEQIDSLDTTTLLVMPEPANPQSSRVIEFMASQMTGSIHIELAEDGATTTKRRISLIPHIGHIKRQVVDYWDLEDLIQTSPPAARVPDGSNDKPGFSQGPSRSDFSAGGESEFSFSEALRGFEAENPEERYSPAKHDAPRYQETPRSQENPRNQGAPHYPDHRSVNPYGTPTPGYPAPNQPQYPTPQAPYQAPPQPAAPFSGQHPTPFGGGQAPHNQPPATPYGNAPYGNAPQGQQPPAAPYGNAPYGNAPQGQQPPVAPYGNAPYGNAPHGNAPQGQQSDSQDAPFEFESKPVAPPNTASAPEAQTPSPVNPVQTKTSDSFLESEQVFSHPDVRQDPKKSSLDIDDDSIFRAPEQDRTPGFNPPPAMHMEMEYTNREAFRVRLQQQFSNREVLHQPFLLLALRMDRSTQTAVRPFDFDFLMDLVGEELRAQDDMLANIELERLVVFLGDSRPEEAQSFFTRLKDRLRQESPTQADHLLHSVSAIVVPDGRPFQNAGEFLAYALDEA